MTRGGRHVQPASGTREGAGSTGRPSWRAPWPASPSDATANPLPTRRAGRVVALVDGARWFPGRSLPGVQRRRGIAAETLGRITDPFAMSLAGGGQVGETIRRMTEGPRFADIGATEHRMAKLMGCGWRCKPPPATTRGVVAGAWTTANQQFVREVAARSRTETEVLRQKQTLRMWLDIANKTLLETQRTAKFLRRPASCSPRAWTSCSPNGNSWKHWSSPPAYRLAPRWTRSTAPCRNSSAGCGPSRRARPDRFSGHRQ